jgi:hypothetical protein
VLPSESGILLTVITWSSNLAFTTSSVRRAAALPVRISVASGTQVRRYIQFVSMMPATSVMTPAKVRRPTLLWCSMATFLGAIVIFLPGVLWTHCTYGSRMGWLIGVVLPLLGFTATFAWLSSPGVPRHATPEHRAARRLFLISGSLLAAPVGLSAIWFFAYAALLVVHFL